MTGVLLSNKLTGKLYSSVSCLNSERKHLSVCKEGIIASMTNSEMSNALLADAFAVHRDIRWSLVCLWRKTSLVASLLVIHNECTDRGPAEDAGHTPVFRRVSAPDVNKVENGE